MPALHFLKWKKFIYPLNILVEGSEFNYGVVMPRTSLMISKNYFYHIKVKANGDSDFYINRDLFWKFLLREISLLEKEFSVEIHSMIILKNEFHLVLRSPLEPVSKIMFFLMTRLTRKIQKSTGRINFIFGGTYKGCLLDHNDLPELIGNYLYQLPLLKNEIEDVSDYKWALAKDSQSAGHSFTAAEMRSIEWGLKRTRFRFLKDRSRGNRPIIPRRCHTSMVAPA